MILSTSHQAISFEVIFLSALVGLIRDSLFLSDLGGTYLNFLTSQIYPLACFKEFLINYLYLLFAV